MNQGPYEPTQKEIREACQRIRAEKGHQPKDKPELWTVPEVRLDGPLEKEVEDE